jgi:hypothetical protein
LINVADCTTLVNGFIFKKRGGKKGVRKGHEKVKEGVRRG